MTDQQKPLSIERSEDGSHWIIWHGQQYYVQRRFSIRATDAPMSGIEEVLVAVCDRLAAAEAREHNYKSVVLAYVGRIHELENREAAAIDAALESVVEYLRERGRTCNRESTASIKRANGNITIYADNLSKEASKIFHYANDIESKFKGTNPLAEAQARIAELERQLEEARKDAERLQYLMDAPGMFYEGGFGYQMAGRLREYIDSAMNKEQDHD